MLLNLLIVLFGECLSWLSVVEHRSMCLTYEVYSSEVRISKVRDSRNQHARFSKGSTAHRHKQGSTVIASGCEHSALSNSSSSSNNTNTSNSINTHRTSNSHSHSHSHNGRLEKGGRRPEVRALCCSQFPITCVCLPASGQLSCWRSEFQTIGGHPSIS